MNLQIRQMSSKDIPKVQEVATESWHSTYEGIIPLHIQNNFLKSAYSNEMMEFRLKHSLLFVAEVDGKIAGFANFSLISEEDKAELSAIYLLESFQGKGLGSALLKEGIKYLDNVKEIYIDVEKDNKVGMTFYKAKGFQVVKEYEEDFDGHLLQTVRMVREVN